MKLTLRFLGLFAALLLTVSSTFAQSANTVARIDIKHVGPTAVSDELIRANIRVKVGDTYIRSAVDDDVKNLYGTGFFYNIQVVDARSDQGIALTYVVQGKPKLTVIKYQGNVKFNNAKLEKKITSKVGQPLDEQKLFTDAQEIQKMYKNAGYPQTEVKYSVSIDEGAGTGTAAFEIQETPKVKIESIEFVGASAFPQSKLRSLVDIRKPGILGNLFGWRTFKQDKLVEGQDKLVEFYRENGYVDFEIKDIQLTYPTPKLVTIKIVIFEGKPYKFGAVTFKGNTLGTAEQLQRGFKMRVGDIYSPQGLSDDVDAVENFYGRLGYIDVTQSSGNLRVNRVPNVETGTMDLEFTIVEGQKSYVEKIEIHGNLKTKDRVIRRELAVTPGETFDMTRVKLSKSRLEGLQYFDKVETRADATEIPTRKNLVVEVDEKSTGNISLGAGFSSVDAIVGFAEVSQGNFDLFHPPTFTGGGQKFRARVQLGTRRQDYEISFIEPWFLGRKLALGLDLYHHQLDFQSLNDLYNERRTGARVSLTRALGSDFLIGSLNATVENVGIDSVPTNAPASIIAAKGDKLLYRLGGSLAYDTRNSTMLPSHGQRTELSTEFVGGDAQFYRIELKTAWYFKGPWEGHILEVVGRAGVMDSLGGSGGIPFYERYYLGGLYSLRGYDYRSIGPREPYNTYTYNTNPPPDNVASTNVINEPIGGNTYWFGSAEYSLPLIDKLRLAFFYDIGSVDAGSYKIQFSDFSDNVGIGLRLNLPIGPLRLDYGIPINHDKYNGGGGKFQFGVGYTREF